MNFLLAILAKNWKSIALAVSVVVLVAGTYFYHVAEVKSAYHDGYDSATTECNAVQMEESILFEKHKADKLAELVKDRERLIQERDARIVALADQKQRVVTVVKKVAAESPNQCAEQLGDSTKAFLSELRGE